MNQGTTVAHDRMTIDWDVPIEMDDGLALRCDVFRPLREGRYPVILAMGPARSAGFLHLHRVGGDAAVEHRQSGPERDLLSRHEPMAGGRAPAAAPHLHVHFRGGIRRPSRCRIWLASTTTGRKRIDERVPSDGLDDHPTLAPHHDAHRREIELPPVPSPLADHEGTIDLVIGVRLEQRLPHVEHLADTAVAGVVASLDQLEGGTGHHDLGHLAGPIEGRTWRQIVQEPEGDLRLDAPRWGQGERHLRGACEDPRLEQRRPKRLLTRLVEERDLPACNGLAQPLRDFLDNRVDVRRRRPA